MPFTADLLAPRKIVLVRLWAIDGGRGMVAITAFVFDVSKHKWRGAIPAGCRLMVKFLHFTVNMKRQNFLVIFASIPTPTMLFRLKASTLTP